MLGGLFLCQEFMKKIVSSLIIVFLLVSLLSAKENYVIRMQITPHKEMSKSIFNKNTLVFTNTGASSSLSGILSSVSGLDLRSYGVPGSLATVSVRGGSASQTLVAVEDVPLNSAQNGLFDLSLFPASGFNRVDIVKGGGSSIFGANASSGYVNFLAARPMTTLFLFSTYYGSFGHFRLMADTSLKMKKNLLFRILGDVETCKNDFSYTNEGESLRRINAGFTNYHLFGSADYKNGVWSTRFTSFFNHKTKGMPGSASVQNPLSFQKDSFFFSSWKLVFYVPLVTESLVSWTYSYNRYYDPLMVTGVLDDTHKTGQLFCALSQEFEKGFLSFRYGVEDRFNTLDSTVVSNRKRNLFSHFISGQASLLKSKLKLSARYRHEISSVYEPVLNWNSGINWEIGKRTVVRANIGTSFREPTFNDLYWPEDAFSKGNPGLVPETSLNIDGGVENRLFAFLVLKISVFRNDYTDLILWSPGAGGKWSPENISKASHQGAEAEVEGEWKQLIKVGFNFTKLYAINKEEGQYYGKYLPNMPFDKFSVNMTGSLGKFRMNAGFHYRGFSYTTKANTVSQATISKEEYKLNASVGYMPMPGLEFVASAENILDDRSPALNNQPVPGRSFGFEVKYKFLKK